MDWVNQSLHIHNTFGNLGFKLADRYHINDNCNVALETILHNILSEDKCLRTYRRSIAFGQNINRDLIPLLKHAEEDKTKELLVKILANLSIPIEYLFSVDDISETYSGQYIISEVNGLLAATKAAFSDREVTKIVIDFLKKNTDFDKKSILSSEQRENVRSSLLLLRNILHIPEGRSNPDRSGSARNMQNQVVWNMFSQSIDKILINLMTVPDVTHWGETLVQLIAQLYKDRSAATLHKLLNVWLETSSSDTSEDFESNTSHPYRDRSDSSLMITSEPTSDSSDTRGTGKCSDEPNRVQDADCASHTPEGGKSSGQTSNGAQIEKQAASTSSNSSIEDQLRLHAALQIHQNLNQTLVTVKSQDKRRKKLTKRKKANLPNVKGLSRNNPTDDYISNVLKEFSVDFLLKGYNSLVLTLHEHIVSGRNLEMDTSHFFWLIAYFLQFATQIQVDLEQISRVLSFDIISYLTAEAVNLCEQFELAIKLDGHELKPCTRRLHLVVTAIRELVKAIEEYGKFAHLSKTDRDILDELRMKMWNTEEVRSLLVLLLRHYNPQYLTRQYLQDLIVTNHVLLLCLDQVIKMPEYKGSANMVDHVKQFATPAIMNQYGMLLESYQDNGEYVNECIFTMMHHVGGEIGCPLTLVQPQILKSFASILASDFEVCDDWSDLMHYVMNTYEEEKHLRYKPEIEMLDSGGPVGESTASAFAGDKWSKDELSFLSWNYVQCSASSDAVGDIVKIFKQNGVVKSKESVRNELLKLNLIGKAKEESSRENRTVQPTNEERDDEFNELCEQLVKDGKAIFLNWVQKVLLETCFAKIYIDKKSSVSAGMQETQVGTKKFGLFKNKSNDLSEVSPVSHHELIHNRSVPLVPWNCAQANVCKDLKFLQFLHRIGFHMPVDTGKVFIRIPHFWTADILYDVAERIMPINTSKLKFSVDGRYTAPQRGGCMLPSAPSRDVPVLSARGNPSQTHMQHAATTVDELSPTPGSSCYSEAAKHDNQIHGNNDFNIEDVSEATSAASDHTLMFVSDEDEELELILPAPAAEEHSDDAIPTKRRRT